MTTAVRKAREDDAEAIAALANELSQELYGENEIDAGEVAHWLDIPDLGTFVATVDGAVVGYADVRDEEHQRFPLDIRLAPNRGEQASETLLHAVEGWARDRGQPGAILRGVVGDLDAILRARYEESGYRLIRHSFLMQTDLGGETTPVEWPTSISVRPFELGRDEERVYEAQQESFADHWDHHRTPFDEWRRQMLDSPHFAPDLSLIAEENAEIAGIAMNAWHFSGDPNFGWVGILGVRRPWRRRGLGSALLRESFARFAQRGATKVGLGVDAKNTTGAVKLYERAGMHVVRRLDLYEKQLPL